MRKNPITGVEKNLLLEREIPSSVIIDRYQKELGMDVSRFFKDTTSISLYRCLDTGYRFYYPSTTAGDDSFYQELEKFPWYYMDWKWEHTITEKMIKSNDRVLEIGSGRGGFIKRIKEAGFSIEGLELNSSAVAQSTQEGLAVYEETIEKFSKTHKDQYDIVCSFQVMEHISDIKSFIEASLAVLKPGGLLVTCIPNNDSVVLRDNIITLNMPPHHMGMWDMHSLIQLQNHFNMKIEDIKLEPLQSYHIGFAHKSALPKIMKKVQEKIGPLSRIFDSLVKRIAFLGINHVSEHIVGHSILAVYKKNE